MRRERPRHPTAKPEERPPVRRKEVLASLDPHVGPRCSVLLREGRLWGVSARLPGRVWQSLAGEKPASAPKGHTWFSFASGSSCSCLERLDSLYPLLPQPTVKLMLVK